MKAADFLYHRPRSVKQAVQLLSEYGGTARILSGGQSLMPMMNLRLWRPAALIDIGSVTELDTIEVKGEETVLGARFGYSRIETHPMKGTAPRGADAADAQQDDWDPLHTDPIE